MSSFLRMLAIRIISVYTDIQIPTYGADRTFMVVLEYQYL